MWNEEYEYQRGLCLTGKPSWKISIVTQYRWNMKHGFQTFPVPGGPKRRMPFHGDRRPVKYLPRKWK